MSLLNWDTPRPGLLSATIASNIAGAQASQIQLAGRLLLPPAALHQAINQAFVDALHGSYLIAAISLLVVAVLAGFLLRQKQRATNAGGELLDSPTTTITIAMQQVVAVGGAEER